MSDSQGMAPETTAFDCPIRTVTVMEDRAAIERSGTTAVTAGECRLRIGDVANVLVDKTLTIRVEGAQLIDSKVRRTRVHQNEAREPEVARLVELEREKRRVFDKTRRHADALREELALINTSGKLLTGDWSADVAWGKADVGSWGEPADALSERVRALHQQMTEATFASADAEEELQDVLAQLKQAQQESSDNRTFIDIVLRADQAGECKVEIDYMVPGACWRPQHTAHRMDGKLRFSTAASIWQHTGEDWEGVELFVSTERASLGVDPPELRSDVLSVKKKRAGTDVQVREQAVETTAGATRDEMPGIDDGGEAWLVPVQGPATINNGGRPHRVPLAEFECEAETTLVVMAELETAVIRRTTLQNAGTRPILAGPVDLIEGSGPVGRTKVSFVAPGEKFDLGFGAEPDLRVDRTARKLREKRGTLSTWHRTPHRVTVRLSNIGAGTHHVQVTERVPVSEVEAVEIEVDSDKTSDGKRADKDGFVTWVETLRPLDRKELKLGYTVSRKGDVRGL